MASGRQLRDSLSEAILPAAADAHEPSGWYRPFACSLRGTCEEAGCLSSRLCRPVGTEISDFRGSLGSVRLNSFRGDLRGGLFLGRRP
jgi:hypothetical protein